MSQHEKFAVLILAAILMSGAGCYKNTGLERGKVVTDASDKKDAEGRPVCGLPSNEAKLRKILTPEQYRIMRENGTEAPFKNAFWDNKKPGIYVDAITGEPLFSSTDKFDSGTGWPSFTQPLEKKNIAEKSDVSRGMTRTEVRAGKSDSHLGHVFDDGPGSAGKRYCINSASLRFIPEGDLEKEGYGRYLPLFGKKAKKDPKADAPKPKTELAVFAAGCFWGVESAFRELDGVVNVTAGYTGGNFKNPSYEDICSGKTSHAEAVQVEYDPSKISYERLLDYFWEIHDPTTLNRQGPDHGTQYRSAIFFNTPGQEKAARLSKDTLQESGKLEDPVVTEIAPAKEFYPAEEYHQRYFEKRGMRPSCHIPEK